MNTTSDHNDIHQMNNTWFTLKHLPKLSCWYGFILCPRKSQQLHKEWWCVEPQTCCCWNKICIPLHPQWYFKNHDIDSNHTAWTHKWKFLKYHTICCIQNVLPEEVPTWHISNKRNLEQITNARALPHPHPSWWQQLHPINFIPSIFEPITSNFKYSLLVVIEKPKSENASSALAYLDGDFLQKAQQRNHCPRWYLCCCPPGDCWWWAWYRAYLC